MDYFERRILAALRDSKPHTFSEIQSQVTFSHNTLQQHLTQLVERSHVTKNPSGTIGRPRYVYHVQPKAVKQIAVALEDPDAELVTLPFSCVRHICRFAKGGWCKERKASCLPQVCPQMR